MAAPRITPSAKRSANECLELYYCLSRNDAESSLAFCAGMRESLGHDSALFDFPDDALRIGGCAIPYIGRNVAKDICAHGAVSRLEALCCEPAGAELFWTCLAYAVGDHEKPTQGGEILELVIALGGNQPLPTKFVAFAPISSEIRDEAIALGHKHHQRLHSERD